MQFMSMNSEAFSRARPMDAWSCASRQARPRHLWPLVMGLATIGLILHANQVSGRQASQEEPNELEATGSYLPNGAEYVPNRMALLAGTSLSDSMGRGFLNPKQARRMSAFVPMRGRKDGRDSPGEADQLPLFLKSMGPESEGEINLVRLMTSDGSTSGLVNRWAPRQFVNQMAARHSVEEEPIASMPIGYQAGPMQAKLRRAFHPMRGKRLQELSAGDWMRQDI